MAERVFTLPNGLTLVRVPLGALIWVAPRERWWLLVILGLAAATDVVDGRVARAMRARRLARGEDPRHLGEPRAIGAWLDPLCDKLFILSVVAAVAYAFRPPLHQILLIAARELVVGPLAIAYVLTPSLRRRLQIDFRARALGKATTALQFAAVFAIIFLPAAATALAAAAALVGLAAAARYASRISP
jgi:cardiolipin synthase